MRIELFYDIVSPYSYLAFESLTRYRTRWNLDLQLRPFFLGGVMKATGNTPPAYLAAKAPYLMRDLGRLSSYFDVPLQVPSTFPGNTLPAMRLLTAVQAELPERLLDVTRALWQRHWAKDQDVVDGQSLIQALAAVAIDGGRANALVDKIADPAVKEALKKNTDEAVARGAFGAPTFFVDVEGQSEMYFGSDRIELMAHALKLAWTGPNPR